MHAYIVFAHPTKRSFTGAVLEALCCGLEEGGHTFEVGDLYAMEFRSDMTLAEYEREMNVHRARASASPGASSFCCPIWQTRRPRRSRESATWRPRIASAGTSSQWRDSDSRHRIPLGGYGGP